MRMSERFGDNRAQSYVYAILFGTIGFLADWAGWRGSNTPWGDPRPLREIWWHFPIFVGGIFVLFRRRWNRNTWRP